MTHQFNEIRKVEALLEKSGWLPHYTTPFHFIEKCGGDAERLNVNIQNYYCEQWQAVRHDLLEHLKKYDLDEETKLTFQEVLFAHETGLFRCVCRALFPEIERLTGIELEGGIIKDDGRIKDKLASQCTLRDDAYLGVSPSEIEPSNHWGHVLVKKLRNHLYKNCKTEEDRQNFMEDTTPNRHAALHGLISYTSAQSSLNMIFMADVVFQITHALKQKRPKTIIAECGDRMRGQEQYSPLLVPR